MKLWYCIQQPLCKRYAILTLKSIHQPLCKSPATLALKSIQQPLCKRPATLTLKSLTKHNADKGQNEDTVLLFHWKCYRRSLPRKVSISCVSVSHKMCPKSSWDGPHSTVSIWIRFQICCSMAFSYTGFRAQNFAGAPYHLECPTNAQCKLRPWTC